MARHNHVEQLAIKTQYQEAVSMITSASENLGGLFQQKMVKIKTKLSTFFAKIELKLQQNNQDVMSIS